ncbi:MAG: hypothetical protein QOJ00_97 [Actinomycetota bacterium]|jgi:hypothetical protein
MKRRWIALIGAGAAIGSVAGLIPASTAHAAEPQVVQLCVTVQPKYVTINGNTVGVPIAVARTCAGV